jgi:SAM-dependent methyltransferase
MTHEGGSMPALDNQDLDRLNPPPTGAVAVANEEAVRAWDTVLYERWKSNRNVFVGALSEVTEDVFDLYPPPEQGRCIDIGCGFGETTQRLAELVGPSGFALGTDSSPRFIEDARREAAEAGVENIEFEIADAQTAEWGPVYDYAFSRMGTQFFAAPVPAMRAIRRALKPSGRLAKVCWRRKAESPFWAETEQVVERFLSRPEECENDTCGPGPFSLGNPRDHPRDPRGRRVRRDRAASARLRLLHGREHGRRLIKSSFGTHGWYPRPFAAFSELRRASSNQSVCRHFIKCARRESNPRPAA